MLIESVVREISVLDFHSLGLSVLKKLVERESSPTQYIGWHSGRRELFVQFKKKKRVDTEMLSDIGFWCKPDRSDHPPEYPVWIGEYIGRRDSTPLASRLSILSEDVCSDSAV